MTGRCRYPGCTDEAATGPLCAFHGPAWRELAACRGTDLEGWYSCDPATVAEHRATCRGCPVIAACRADVLAAEEGLPASRRFGIRGGWDPAQRVRAVA